MHIEKRYLSLLLMAHNIKNKFKIENYGSRL